MLNSGVNISSSLLIEEPGLQDDSRRYWWVLFALPNSQPVFTPSHHGLSTQGSARQQSLQGKDQRVSV